MVLVAGEGARENRRRKEKGFGIKGGRSSKGLKFAEWKTNLSIIVELLLHVYQN